MNYPKKCPHCGSSKVSYFVEGKEIIFSCQKCKYINKQTRLDIK